MSFLMDQEIKRLVREELTLFITTEEFKKDVRETALNVAKAEILFSQELSDKVTIAIEQNIQQRIADAKIKKGL